jgi:hypothetical protein
MHPSQRDPLPVDSQASGRSIGGFLPRETPGSRKGPFHAGLLELSSGRAALALVLSHVHAKRVHLPFFVCDALVDAVRSVGAEPLFHALDADLLPPPEIQPAADDMLLLIDFFGVRSARIASLAQVWQHRCVVDNTQAFFQQPVPGAWTFYSARKFFGVADGAYLAAPVPIDVMRLPQATPSGAHLASPDLGGLAAFEMFQQQESLIDCVPRRMSAVSHALLDRLDYRQAILRRTANARYLHARLAERNLLAEPMSSASVGPLCYPLLLEAPVARDALGAHGLFIPTFWKEVLTRPGAADFAREQRLAAHLIPLPVDHRYGPHDMQILLDRLLPLLPPLR